MKTRLHEDVRGNVILAIPVEVLEQLGWSKGDEVALDIQTVYSDQLIIYRTNNHYGDEVPRPKGVTGG